MRPAVITLAAWDSRQARPYALGGRHSNAGRGSSSARASKSDCVRALSRDVRDVHTIEEMKESRRITHGHKWKLLGLTLLLVLINLLGLAVLVVGLLVS